MSVAGESANQHVSEEIAESLRAVDKEDLVRLLSDLVKIYVIEGTASLDVEPPPLRSGGQRERVSFAELITDLKERLDVPELDSFRVEGEKVFVTIGDQTFCLDKAAAPRRATPADAPRAATPTKRDAGKKPASGERSRLIEVD